MQFNNPGIIRCSEDPQTSHLDVTGDGRTLKGTVVEFSDIQPLFKLIGKEKRDKKGY